MMLLLTGGLAQAQTYTGGQPETVFWYGETQRRHYLVVE